VSVPDAGTRRLLRRIANEHPAGKPMWLTVGEVVAFLDAADALEEAEHSARMANETLHETEQALEEAERRADKAERALELGLQDGEEPCGDCDGEGCASCDGTGIARAAGGGAGPGEEPTDD
jgi:hypothetical protein